MDRAKEVKLISTENGLDFVVAAMSPEDAKLAIRQKLVELFGEEEADTFELSIERPQ